jgi:thymidylate kinase
VSRPRRIIVNIRGPNASGKTTLARHFHQPNAADILPVWGAGENTLVPFTTKIVEGLQLPVRLLGQYDGKSKYEGCDKIKSVGAIQSAVRRMSTDPLGGHVVFEGFRVSKRYGPYAELRSTIVHENRPDVVWLWALSDISEALMYERAQARSPDRELNRPELAATWRQMRNTIAKARAAFPAEQVLLLDARLSPEELFGQLVARMGVLESVG